ncbi:MmpL efflux pump, putative [Entamoeba histolytica HM-1:IMSS-B]|uniref:MmpL efflux pump, putative n=6 Tax=Entamoeba histolytica TaxID=5759 RepID=C4M1I3_ENTH1|nr:MmpL efflux pump, putative [Entamoeba histolytica HM-1:IMSS]EMD44327.1 MmpL efflux pump, putative [Entamoeba histolytica KU27]EMH75166.1 MmpL efflux pump, putative [Entamoeba histolytica HM-1:IMSS-B]ENY61402.1 MmpL efflux pump, putative [Entamoeba histolytica HM-1:IMSS-A]GAT95076.1 mmpl efflux pump putative [Entamoeba histolytica]EAL44934.1 MmpL efflux pump, putative [Entamoeba histolytica HM-1:IMSS]|eukprot:XP_650320.1 MmpL efflux pump, putative [Entamoeba histolytica HM-1:IMSS]
MINIKEIQITLSNIKNKLFDFLFYIIKKGRYGIIGIWIIIALCCSYFALNIFSLTTVQFSAPPDSLAAKGNIKFEELYPSHSSNEISVVVITKEDGGNVLTETIKELSYQIFETAEQNNATFVLGVYSNLTETIDITDYFVENDTTVILMSSPIDCSSHLIQEVRKTIERFNCDGYRISVTGMTAASMDITKSIIYDMKHMDIFIFPIAIIIFLYVIRNIVLVIIPICNLIIILSTSFGTLYPLAKYSEYYSIAPAINVSLIVAMSVDYSLFLLSRYSEEIRKEQSHEQAVKTMLKQSGRIVATSGIVLMCCFLSCCFYGVTIIVTMGLGCVICLIFTVMVNLTITPSLLLIFPRFFRIKGLIPCNKWCVKYSNNVGSLFWHIQAEWMSKIKNSIVVLFIALCIMLPIIICMKDFKWTMDPTQCFPSNAEAIEGLEDIEKVMTPGMISPYKLLILSDPMNSISYEFMKDFGNNITENIGKENIICYNYIKGNIIPQRVVKMLQNIKVYSQYFNYSTTSESFLCYLIPQNVDEMQEIVDQTIDLLNKLNKKFGIVGYILGTNTDMVMLVEYILDFFPIQLTILIITILILITFAFQSILMAFRVIFTTALTLAWVFGISTVIFTSNIFYDFGILYGPTGLFWSVPVMCTDVLVGLCLDYDIFLFSRVLEYRKKGCSTKLSIILGVEHTGYLITYAGLIMAAAFSALLLSSMPVLKQFGVVLSFAVLLDTFVIRTMVVPSLLHLFGELNWWPRKYPVKFNTYSEFLEHQTDQTPLLLPSSF